MSNLLSIFIRVSLQQTWLMEILISIVLSKDSSKVRRIDFVAYFSDRNQEILVFWIEWFLLDERFLRERFDPNCLGPCQAAKWNNGKKDLAPNS